MAAVAAVVVGVSVVQLGQGQMKARDAQRKADVELVGRALAAYFVEHDQYPPGSNGLIVSCGGRAIETCGWGGENLGDGEGTVYLRKLPVDPLADRGATYVYEVNETRQKFRLYVALEWRRDPAYKNNLTAECGSNVQCNWYVESR